MGITKRQRKLQAQQRLRAATESAQRPPTCVLSAARWSPCVDHVIAAKSTVPRSVAGRGAAAVIGLHRSATKPRQTERRNMPIVSGGTALASRQRKQA